MWFPPSLAEERVQLDDALLAWLVSMRESYTSQVERLGFPVFSKRVVDALIALQLLGLPQARAEIRDSVDAWLCWLSPLRLAPERDPALECHRLLTQGQPDRRHAATWLRLAADVRAEYLTVALAGLRQLPNRGDAKKNQVLMVQALLHHATTTAHDVNGALEFFKPGLGALRGRYPLGRRHWDSVLEEALPRFQHQVSSQIATNLVAKLQKRKPANQRHPLSSRRRLPASEQERKALLSDIGDAQDRPERLAQRLFAILEKNDHYALATGNSFPFVRTLCYLGREMLERHRLGASDMYRFGAMIERALALEPANPHCWMLWAQWHQVQGRWNAEEAILREMLRVFPRDVPSHVELARLLIWRGEEYWQEAESFLRWTLGQDPNSGHAHVVLAHLQSSRGQLERAEATLAGFLADHPGNEAARNFLDRLRAGQYTAQVPPSADTLRHASQRADTVGDTASAASALREVERRGSLAAEFSRAQLTNGKAPQTTRIRQESREGDPLAGFYSQWLQLEDTPECPPHAWAWDACRHWQQGALPEAWRDLAERFPEAASETDFLRSLACTELADREGWYSRGTQEGASGRPVDILMQEMTATWDELAADHNVNQRVSDDIARTVMACAAANTPEFTASLD